MVDNELLLDICLSADDYINKYRLDAEDAWSVSEQNAEAVVRKHIAIRAAQPPTTTITGTEMFRTCDRCSASICVTMAAFDGFDGSLPLPTRYCPNCGAKIKGIKPF